MITSRALTSNAFAAFFALCPQMSFADGFTGHDVLAWSVEQQNNYFQVSVTMIGIVATQTGEHAYIAECIDSWKGGGEDSIPVRGAFIRNVMEGLPNYHPQAIVLAVIEKECGDF